MVYRLKNWTLLRDLMCSSHKEAKYIVINALRETASIMAGRTEIMEYKTVPINEDNVTRMINAGGCPISQDGFEICLLTWREDISPMFKCEGECDAFEIFLEKLDDILQNVKSEMAEKHIL